MSPGHPLTYLDLTLYVQDVRSLESPDTLDFTPSFPEIAPPPYTTNCRPKRHRHSRHGQNCIFAVPCSDIVSSHQCISPPGKAPSPSKAHGSALGEQNHGDTKVTGCMRLRLQCAYCIPLTPMPTASACGRETYSLLSRIHRSLHYARYRHVSYR